MILQRLDLWITACYSHRSHPTYLSVSLTFARDAILTQPRVFVTVSKRKANGVRRLSPNRERCQVMEN